VHNRSGGILTTTIALTASLTLCVTLSSQSTPAPTQPSRTRVSTGKSAARPAAPPHAEWTASIESVFGITQKQFSEAGLFKLTETEVSTLLLAVYEIRQQAVDTAQKAQIAYTCGPIPASYDKIKLYVDVSENTPTEIASGVRQRLRGLPDVEIVYVPIEADVGIAIVGFENELLGGRKTGYSASVVTYDPCKGSGGDKDWPIQMLNNHFILTAASIPEIVETAVSHLDTRDLEAARKFHAAMKKVETPK